MAIDYDYWKKAYQGISGSTGYSSQPSQPSRGGGGVKRRRPYKKPRTPTAPYRPPGYGPYYAPRRVVPPPVFDYYGRGEVGPKLKAGRGAFGAAKGRAHTITEGETPLSIAKKYGISQEELARANQAVFSYTPGAVLNVPTTELNYFWRTLDTLGKKAEGFLRGVFGEEALGMYGEMNKALAEQAQTTFSGTTAYTSLPDYFGPGPAGPPAPEAPQGYVEPGEGGKRNYKFYMRRQSVIRGITRGDWPGLMSAEMARSLGFNAADMEALGYTLMGQNWVATAPDEDYAFGAEGAGAPEELGEGGGGGGGYGGYGGGGYYGRGRGGRGGGGGGGGYGGGGYVGGERLPYSIETGGTFPSYQYAGINPPIPIGYIHWRIE